MTGEELRVRLSWAILELKFAYYYPHRLHRDWSILLVDDSIYDAIEDQYKIICKSLNLPPTACNMVGFDDKRAASRMVMSMLTEPKNNKISHFERLSK
jgi:hypothetical protein